MYTNKQIEYLPLNYQVLGYMVIMVLYSNYEKLAPFLHEHLCQKIEIWLAIVNSLQARVL